MAVSPHGVEVLQAIHHPSTAEPAPALGSPASLNRHSPRQMLIREADMIFTALPLTTTHTASILDTTHSPISYYYWPWPCAISIWLIGLRLNMSWTAQAAGFLDLPGPTTTRMDQTRLNPAYLAG